MLQLFFIYLQPRTGLVVWLYFVTAAIFFCVRWLSVLFFYLYSWSNFFIFWLIGDGITLLMSMLNLAGNFKFQFGRRYQLPYDVLYVYIDANWFHRGKFFFFLWSIFYPASILIFHFSDCGLTTQKTWSPKPPQVRISRVLLGGAVELGSMSSSEGGDNRAVVGDVRIKTKTGIKIQMYKIIKE